MHADINQSLTLNSVVALLERPSVVVLINVDITSVLISSEFPHDDLTNGGKGDFIRHDPSAANVDFRKS
jgi:hypothetical protein